MAYDGELVRMENGRWARFQRCRICTAGPRDINDDSLLVAVELSPHYQSMLDAAEDSVESYRLQGIPMELRLAPGDDGKLAVVFEAPHEARL
jgi:hypothetical protein